MPASPISVAIPYHQNPAYLREALESVKQQTLLPACLILIDNSETDDAVPLLKDFPCEVRHLRTAPYLGLAAYFNQC
ncbi:MAG: glycosyltransferase, partial [Rickettsiales bacterium]|nr:glycosyltransferase [Rickettsiales bacterium]